MRTRLFHRGTKWAVYVIGSDKDDPGAPGQPQSELLAFLDGLDGPDATAALKFRYLVERFADDARGPSMLGVDTSHDICTAKLDDGTEIKIWQITAKSIRVLYFYCGERIVICTSGFVKKGNKAPASEQEKARRHCKMFWTENVMASMTPRKRDK